MFDDMVPIAQGRDGETAMYVKLESSDVCHT